MQCLVCGGSYVESSERYIYKDPVVGDISVDGLKFYRCDKCGDVLFTPEILDVIEKQVKERKEQLIGSLPIRDFVTTTETAKLLGVSRQALNKNQRIKKGFIHQTTFGENVAYVRKSVIQFRRTGDGRYPLYINKFKVYSLLPSGWKQASYIQKQFSSSTNIDFKTARLVGKVLSYGK